MNQIICKKTCIKRKPFYCNTTLNKFKRTSKHCFLHYKSHRRDFVKTNALKLQDELLAYIRSSSSVSPFKSFLKLACLFLLAYSYKSLFFAFYFCSMPREPWCRPKSAQQKHDQSHAYVGKESFSFKCVISPHKVNFLVQKHLLQRDKGGDIVGRRHDGNIFFIKETFPWNTILYSSQKNPSTKMGPTHQNLRSLGNTF